MRVLVVAVVLCGLGAAVAWQVNGALGIDVRPADVPVERAVAAPATALAPVPAIGSIVVPDDERLRLAAGAVAEALVTRGAPRPSVGAGPGPVLATQVDGGLTGESYRVDGLTIAAGTTAGAAAGLYAVADRIRSGAPLPAGTVTPRLGLRLIDLGAVGLPDDPARYASGTDYSLNSDVVSSAILPDAPYVDLAAVDRIADQYRQLVRHALAQGYNAVVVPGFLEYVTFRGQGVYPDGDPHVARAEAMAAAFAPVWRHAADLGMKVFLQTDMLALSPPLRDHLDRVAGMDTEDDRLWQVYRAGLRELFDRMPFVAGLMIRIGEGGAAYKLPGWDYSSEIAVTTPSAVRAMLRAFLSVAGPADKDIIFRTWSVGIGIGDLHTSTETYDRVLGGLDNDEYGDHLVVSTKYSAGDFYSHLPFNETLLHGTHRRIVEFQSRREFENFGALPNDLGPLHQAALRTFLAGNPHVEGVWSWAQGGGPLLAGPRTLFLRQGFWQLYDLNSYLTGRLAWDPDTDPSAATADWLRATFSHDPDTVAALGRVMALSRDAVTKGLYIGPYANLSVKALGLEPPPMMWIFEWDIVTGDSAVWDTIYQVSRDRLPAAVGEGEEAVADASRMRDLVASTDRAAWRDPVLRKHFVDTLDYQVNLFEVLSAYRTTMLRHAEWLDTGAQEAEQAWHTAAARYERARADHLARYGDDRDLPAFKLTAADIGLSLAERDATMAWLARGLLVLLVLTLAFRRRLWARALWTAATRPWRLATLRDTPATRADRVLVWAVPGTAVVLSRAIQTSFAAPAHLVLVLGAWLLFALVLRLPVRDPFLLTAAIGGVALVRTVLLLAALVLRGPGHYWFDFWTDPVARSMYITVAFALFLAVFASTYVVLRTAYGLSRRRVTGRLLLAAGTAVTVLGGLVTIMGAEQALTVWNDQLALLPWGLHRILGILVFLEIPPDLPLFVTAAGLVLVVVGAALAFRAAGRLRRPPVRRGPGRADPASPGRRG